jgi:hypothetical protein
VLVVMRVHSHVGKIYIIVLYFRVRSVGNDVGTF